MIKTPIGILDMGIDNLSILNYLSQVFKNEHFIYINDLENPDYEALTEDNIEVRVRKNVEELLARNVKLIVVVSNTIVEYCREYFDKIDIPVINIVDSIIDYVNENYEHKNMAFIATLNIINANLYQKFFKYNHLYNLVSDDIEKFLHNHKVKTSESFDLTRDLLRSVLKKDINIIIPSSFNMMLLKTEMAEYLPTAILINLFNIIEDKIKAALLTIENFCKKGRGSVEIIININKKDVDFSNLLTIKYQLTTTFTKTKKKDK